MCLPIGHRQSINHVVGCRWRSDDNASLRRHPIYVARTVQQFFADLPPSYGISACLPLAAAEANINLTALKQQPAIGQPMRKFLSEQLKDKNDVKKTYRVRLAVRRGGNAEEGTQ